MDAWAWQESWDRQQESYLPDREHRFSAMLDAVDALDIPRDGSPRVLDLAGGTGSISLRLLRRHPTAELTLLDLDPVLLAIARASLPDRVTITATDLRDPSWRDNLAARDCDAILTATALHWLTAERLGVLYRELHGLLRPGGILINADHMPDDGLPALSGQLSTHADAVRTARYRAGVALSWEQWWDLVSADPTLGPLKTTRDELFSIHHAQEWNPPATWHLDALRDAGFTETGLLWRGGTDAAVVAVR